MVVTGDDPKGEAVPTAGGAVGQGLHEARRGGPVIAPVQQGDGHCRRPQVLDGAVLDDHALQRPAVGDPGVPGAVGGDGRGQVPHHPRRQGDGQRPEPAHGLAHQAGRPMPVHGEAGQEAQAANRAAGRLLVGVGGQAHQQHRRHPLGVAGGKSGGQDGAGRVGHDDGARGRWGARAARWHSTS